jgi:tetratricopeptide (TPR) repeat protein
MQFRLSSALTQCSHVNISPLTADSTGIYNGTEVAYHGSIEMDYNQTEANNGDDCLPLIPSRHIFPEAEYNGQLLQDYTRFGHSAIWQLAEDYYANQSIDAWKQIPFFITGSMNIADAYSDFILGYWQDLPDHMPLTVVELSTGSGRLSFLLLKLLSEKLVRYPQLQNRPFKYVMTDFTRNNVEFWMNHANFQPYIEQGMLDFALFNPMTDTQFDLLIQEQPLRDTAIVGIANYTLDALPSDYFQVREHNLHTCEMALHLELECNHDILPNVIELKHIKPEFYYQQTNPKHYPHALWNSLLAKQGQQYFNASFFFPYGGLAALEVLKSSSNGEMTLMSSDKGYVQRECNVGLYDPSWSMHDGVFSTMANYDVIMDWFTLQGGTTYSSVTDSSLSLETVVCTISQHHTQSADAEHPLNQGQLAQAAYQHLYRTNTICGLWDWMIAGTNLEPTGDATKDKKMVRQLLSCLRISLCDPYTMADIATILAQLTDHISYYARKDITRYMTRALELYYPFSGEPILPYKLAVLFMCLGDYPMVIELCNHAIKTSRTEPRVFALLGRSYENLMHYDKAIDYYRVAVSLDPEAILPRERLNNLELVVEQNNGTDKKLRALLSNS